MFELVNKNGVCYFKSSLIRSAHGFSTRLGGVSALSHTASLNLAFGRGDDDETVLKNVELFSNAVGIDPTKLISVPQIHSNDVKFVSENEAGCGVLKKADFECDGYISETSGLPIGVKTADCVPILLEARDKNGAVLAVSAVHAGWRGTAERIAERAVEKLCSLGAEPQYIYAAIGACIDECCYEVGEDFARAIAEKLGKAYENEFVKRLPDGSLRADLKGMNMSLLQEAGVPASNIDVSPYCTCCSHELFYSHRRQKGQRGAHLNLICK